MAKKILIQDEITKEYYCVEKTVLGGNGKMTCGPNDFPFWDIDIEQAEDFASERLAFYEMELNDLTVDGTRKPVIVAIEQ